VPPVFVFRCFSEIPLQEKQKDCCICNATVPLILFENLRHLVELQCELALLVSSVVLVKDSLGNSLVYLLYSSLVSFCSGSLVTCINSSVVLLYNGAELALEHLVLKSPCGNNLYTLFSGLNVRHGF